MTALVAPPITKLHGRLRTGRAELPVIRPYDHNSHTITTAV